MDFKIVSFVALFLVSLVSAQGDQVYDCLEPDQCAGDTYALFAVVGNKTLCCNEGDAITFTAQNYYFYYEENAYVHMESNNTVKKRSAGDANNTIEYGCSCTPLDSEDVRPPGIYGSFARAVRYLYARLSGGGSIVRYDDELYSLE